MTEKLILAYVASAIGAFVGTFSSMSTITWQREQISALEEHIRDEQALRKKQLAECWGKRADELEGK